MYYKCCAIAQLVQANQKGRSQKSQFANDPLQRPKQAVLIAGQHVKSGSSVVSDQRIQSVVSDQGIPAAVPIEIKSRCSDSFLKKPPYLRGAAKL